MMYNRRPLVRVWLHDNWEKWSQAYADKVASGKTDFAWATFNGERVNHRLLPLLEDMTQNHCAFCDGYPCVSHGATIEHFKPKSRFPLESYKWDNLFLCCSECQKKGEDFDVLLLKPDEEGYSFNRYFLFNAFNGRIEVNLAASAAEQEQAEITIKMYRFNEAGRPQARLTVFKNYKKTNEPNIDDFAYRFVL